MANKSVTLKKKNGDVFLPKTSVEQVTGLANELSEKQPKLNTAQNAAVNSGITASKVANYDALVGGNDDLLSKTEASETYATKELVEGLGKVRFVEPGADLSTYSDNDLLVEVDVE